MYVQTESIVPIVECPMETLSVEDECGNDNDLEIYSHFKWGSLDVLIVIYSCTFIGFPVMYLSAVMVVVGVVLTDSSFLSMEDPVTIQRFDYE